MSLPRIKILEKRKDNPYHPPVIRKIPVAMDLNEMPEFNE